MLNSYSVNNSSTNNNNQVLNINAVGGTLVKTYRSSFFKRFNTKSEMAMQVFDSENPHILFVEERLGEYNRTTGLFDEIRNEEKRPVVVIQTMLCGNNELMAELMWKEDFDKMFEEN